MLPSRGKGCGVASGSLHLPDQGVLVASCAQVAKQKRCASVSRFTEYEKFMGGVNSDEQIWHTADKKLLVKYRTTNELFLFTST